MKRVMMTMVLVLAALASVGCQQNARVEWESPGAVDAQPAPLYVGDLSAVNRQGGLWGSKAEGESIGKHTFTVFAIPVGNINAAADTPVKPSFDKAIREALTASGYELHPASEAPPGQPVLTGEIRDCFFWSYSWFWPVFVQGGQTKVALTLSDSKGNCLWTKEFGAYSPGMGFIGSFGFDDMVKSAMTRMLRDITKECSGQKFREVASWNVAAGPAE